MKKLNNKGFAISTLLYALVLMMFFIVLALMAILGTTRNNTSDLSAATKNLLMEYGSKKTDVEITYNEDYGEVYLYKVKEDGWYSTLLVGQGFDGSTRGSAATGIIYLKKGEFLTIILPNAVDKDDLEPASIIFNEDEDHPEYTIMSTMGYSNTSNNYHGREYTINGYAGSVVSDELKNLDRNPIFYNGFIIPAVNPAAGYFRIHKISNNEIDNNPLTQYRPELNGVRYIRDCVRENTVNKWGQWTEIQAIDQNGNNVALDKAVTYPSNNTRSDSTRFPELITDGNIYDQENGYFDLTAASENTDKCVTVDLGANYNLNEIAIWHYYADNRRYRSNHVEVGATIDSMNEIYKYPAADSVSGEPFGQQDLYQFNILNNSKWINHDSILGNRISRFQPKLNINSEQVEGHYYIYAEEYENSSNYIPRDTNIRLLYSAVSDYTFQREVHILSSTTNISNFSKFEPTARWIIKDGRNIDNHKRIKIYTDEDPINKVDYVQNKVDIIDACLSGHCSGTSNGIHLNASWHWVEDSEVLLTQISNSKYFYLRGNMLQNTNLYPNLFYYNHHLGYPGGAYLHKEKIVDAFLNHRTTVQEDLNSFKEKNKTPSFTFSFYKLY